MDAEVYRVERNDVYGRHLVASRDIKPGEVILKEKPAIVGPQIQATHLCIKCNKHLRVSLKICKGCGIASVCSLDCDGHHHPEAECAALKDTNLRAMDVVNCPQIMMPFRCLLLRRYDTDTWKKLMMMESHLDDSRGTEIWKTHQRGVEEELTNLGQLNDDDAKEETVQRICGILDVNTFELRPPNLNGMITNPADCLRGLYLKASLMTHDCIGNTLLSVDDEFEMTVHSSTSIKSGEPIFFNYSNCLKGTHERRQHLKRGKYFDCNCKRCSDPSELGTYLSSMRCTKCRNGYVVPSVPLSDTYKTTWKCEGCSAVYKGILIKTTMNHIKDNIDGLDHTNLAAAENLLDKLMQNLSPQHYLILELKQCLIAMHERNTFSSVAMRRKIQLCKDMIDVLKVIEPGISRLQGIALYQLQATQVNLANQSYHCKESLPGKYVEDLLEAEVNLTASIKFLVYEPPRSPEGRLAHQAIGELKILRSIVKQLTPIVEIKLSEKNDVLHKLVKPKKKLK